MINFSEKLQAFQIEPGTYPEYGQNGDLLGYATYGDDGKMISFDPYVPPVVDDAPKDTCCGCGGCSFKGAE